MNPTMRLLQKWNGRLARGAGASGDTVDLERKVLALQDAHTRTEANDELLARITHALRNPLAAISAAVEVLDAPGTDGELASEARAIIRRQTRLLAQMLQDLGDGRRGDAQRVTSPQGAGAGGAVWPRVARRNVLVVDDNEETLTELRAKLELDGHQVSMAADGIAGLAMLLRQAPEVSIVDAQLTGLSGFDLARRARAAGYAGRMIAVSGGAAWNEPQSRRAGFDAWLAKPVDRGELRRSLESH